MRFIDGRLVIKYWQWERLFFLVSWVAVAKKNDQLWEISTGLTNQLWYWRTRSPNQIDVQLSPRFSSFPPPTSSSPHRSCCGHYCKLQHIVERREHEECSWQGRYGERLTKKNMIKDNEIKRTSDQNWTDLLQNGFKLECVSSLWNQLCLSLLMPSWLVLVR